MEIRKVNVKHRYPWKSLEVGESFTIPANIAGGIKFHRQLVYAANKSFEKKHLENRYKSYLQSDGSVEVSRIA